jgi:hypothetical protein
MWGADIFRDGIDWDPSNSGSNSNSKESQRTSRKASNSRNASNSRHQQQRGLTAVRSCRKPAVSTAAA